MSEEQRRGQVTDLIQVLNQPHGIVVSEVWHTLFILLPAKHVAELAVKTGQRLVEVMDSL